MGNTCVGSINSQDGLFSYVLPTSLLWFQQARGMEISYAPSSPLSKNPNTNAIEIVHEKPPEIVKINGEEMKPIRPNKQEKEVDSNNPSEKQKRHMEQTSIPLPAPTTGQREVIGPIESSIAKKLHDVKGLAVKVAGLQVESVLLRKSGYLKDYYDLGPELGKGHYGTTFLCIEKATGKKYACKSIPKVKLERTDDVDDVRREIRIMHHLAGCPNVISIKEAYENAVEVHVVMELCAGGELFDRIVEIGHFTERKAAKLARTIVSVIEACHSLGVMHRDLKPENFLFVDDHEDSTLKAIDFGMSVFFKPGDIFSDVVGSAYYIAPEVLRKRYGPEADIWSAGVIIYILLCGIAPFWGESEQEIFQEVLYGDVDYSSDPWPNISDSAKDLVRKMLVRDPRKRITVHEILRHPWIQDDGVAPDKALDSAVLRRLKQFSAMNKLKKMALKVIAENLSEEEISGLKEMFQMIDTDNSGQITFEKLKVGLKVFGANLSESEIFNLLQAADFDKSGTIDYGEFVAATLHLSKVDREDHFVAAFSYFDRKGSGYITQDELRKACEEFGMEDVCLEEMIREADQNNDGQIDYNEFVAMMQRGNEDLGTSGLNSNTSFTFDFREALSVY